MVSRTLCVRSQHRAAPDRRQQPVWERDDADRAVDRPPGIGGRSRPEHPGEPVLGKSSTRLRDQRPGHARRLQADAGWQQHAAVPSWTHRWPSGPASPATTFGSRATTPRSAMRPGSTLNESDPDELTRHPQVSRRPPAGGTEPGRRRLVFLRPHAPHTASKTGRLRRCCSSDSPACAGGVLQRKPGARRAASGEPLPRRERRGLGRNRGGSLASALAGKAAPRCEVFGAEFVQP